MNLQEELKALKERIAELEEQAKEEQEFPQDGDIYWYISLYGAICCESWDGDNIETYMLGVGNVYKTEQEAEFAVEKMKVEAELRKYSRPFKEGENENWFILWGTYKKEVQIDWSRKLVRQGTIYFESREKANEAVESVGEERIKKYIFGVED